MSIISIVLFLGLLIPELRIYSIFGIFIVGSYLVAPTQTVIILIIIGLGWLYFHK